MEEHWCLLLYKVSCTSFKKYLEQVHIKYTQFILQNILKMFITKGICFNATLTHGNCSERWVAPVLCEWGSVLARARPAAALALRGEGSRSRGEGRTRKQWVLQYCLVLEVGCEDPDQGVGNEVLCQQADVEVQVLTSCDAGLARSRRRRSCGRWQGNGAVLDERGGVTLVLMRGGAPSP